MLTTAVYFCSVFLCGIP